MGGRKQTGVGGSADVATRMGGPADLAEGGEDEGAQAHHLGAVESVGSVWKYGRNHKGKITLVNVVILERRSVTKKKKNDEIFCRLTRRSQQKNREGVGWTGMGWR